MLHLSSKVLRGCCRLGAEAIEALITFFLWKCRIECVLMECGTLILQLHECLNFPLYQLEIDIETFMQQLADNPTLAY